MAENDKDRRELRRWWRALGFAWTIVIIFPVCAYLGYILGEVVDESLGTEPLFTVFFLLLGIAAGFWNIFREIRLLERDDKPSK